MALSAGRPLQREAVGAILIFLALAVWVGGHVQLLPEQWRTVLAKLFLLAGAALAISSLV